MVSLQVMAVDRYIAVCHSFSERIQKLRSRRAAYLITIVTWTVCILISTPTMISTDVAGHEPYCKCRYGYKVEIIDFVRDNLFRYRPV